MRYYADFQLTGDEPYWTLCELMRAVHGFNAQATPDERLAVDFPLAEPSRREGSVTVRARAGNVLRVFGSVALLGTFCASGIAAKLLRLGAARLQTMQPCPQASRFRRVLRNRTFEKGFEAGAYARRMTSRAARAQREYRARARTHDDGTFGLAAKSESTGQSFFLDVAICPVESDAAQPFADISSYGFCGEHGCVPVF